VRFTLTLSPTAGPSVDVTVDADPGAPLACVADELTRAAGRPGADLFTGSRRLDSRATLGQDALLAGAVLGVGAPGPRSRRCAAVLELRVVGGPNAGICQPLPHGEVAIGRDLTAEICLDDPDLSRRHATVSSGRDGVTARDLGSTNGSTLDGVPLDGEPVRFAPGALLRIGESTVTLAVADDPPAAVRPAADGTAIINRPPRIAPAPSDIEVTFPAEPVKRTPSKLPILGSLLPLVAGVAMAVLMHAPQFLLFTVLSPIMLVGNAVSERRGLRRGRRHELTRYAEDRAAAERQLAAAVALDERTRRSETPDPATVLRTATGPGQRLWERRAEDRDSLRIGVGTADLPARVRVRRDGEELPSPVASNVPAVVELLECGVLGIAGPRPPIEGLARSIAAQLGALHSPRDLALTLLAVDSAAGSWEWSRWLPQLDTGDGTLRVGLTAEQRTARVCELTRMLDARSDSRHGDREQVLPRMVVLIDGAADLRDLPGLTRLLADGPRAGIHAVCFDREPRLLPAECGAVVEITGEVGTRARLIPRDGPAVDHIVVDGLDRSAALALARALAPLRDGGTDADQGVPATSRLLPLLDLERPTAERIAAGWSRGGRGTAALIGESADGPYTVDIARDGPHALVAGTTGAGKSELLQTIIASLAVANRPDAMTFVLIDYKGGAAFKDCIHLPHTVGMVTDLDGHLTERALASLNAELKRREQLLATVGAKDIEDYWSTLAPASGDPMPRLVLVIDEFASLVEELPDFVTGLVGIAMRGRSLGVHLILATQRPSGVVSPVIRANTNLRIALRVTDDAESRDVIDTAAAAMIGAGTPGRAIARIGSAPPLEFQSGRVGGRATAAGAADIGPAAGVRTSRWVESGAPAMAVAGGAGEGETDLQQLVTGLRAAADRAGQRRPRSPWLPPLPTVVSLADLASETGTDLGTEKDTEKDTLPYALADHPDQQRRGVVGLDLARSAALAIVGGPRTGRTSLLRTLIGAAVQKYAPTDLHLYLFDCAGGGLLAAGDLPHCGAVCARHDVVRGDRVLTRLTDELRRRQALLAQQGFSSVAEQRAHCSEADRLPWILLLIDGWSGFGEEYEAVDHGRPVDMLLRLAREGAAMGVQTVATGDRQLISGRTGSAFPGRIVLRLPERNEYALVDVPARSVPDTMPEGRAIMPDGLVEIQIALLEADPSGPHQIAALRQLAADAARDTEIHDPARLPFEVRELPEHVEMQACTRPATARPLWTLIGAAGDAAETVGIDLSADGPGFLVTGPPRSGRSTALRTMALSLASAGTRVALVLPRRSPLQSLQQHAGVVGIFGPEDAAALEDVLDTGPIVVLVDDVHTMTDAPVGEVLTATLHADDGQRAVVVSGGSDELGMAFRGLSMAVRASRAGLLLQPAAADGDLLSVRIPRMTSNPLPGRGLLVIGGEITPVQTAMGEPATSAGVVRPAGCQATGEIGREAVRLARL
jgi:S-DNA-T family DNA segregation ATPase FtsK/SpoIIIE